MSDHKRPEEMTDGELAAELKEFWSIWIGFDADGTKVSSVRVNNIASEAMSRFRKAASENRIARPGENLEGMREDAARWRDANGATPMGESTVVNKYNLQKTLDMARRNHEKAARLDAALRGDSDSEDVILPRGTYEDLCNATARLERLEKGDGDD